VGSEVRVNKHITDLGKLLEAKGLAGRRSPQFSGQAVGRNKPLAGVG